MRRRERVHQRSAGPPGSPSLACQAVRLPQARPGRRNDFVHYGLRNKKLLFGLGLELILVLVAIIGPYLAKNPPTQITPYPLQRPGSKFWLGTDLTGYDLYLQLQTAYIRASFQTGIHESSSPQAIAVPDGGAKASVGPDLTTEAIQIADDICEAAILADGGTASWVTMAYFPEAQRFQVAPMTPQLYDGLSGVALFLAAAARVKRQNSASGNGATIPGRHYSRDRYAFDASDPGRERNRSRTRSGLRGVRIGPLRRVSAGIRAFGPRRSHRPARYASPHLRRRSPRPIEWIGWRDRRTSRALRSHGR